MSLPSPGLQTNLSSPAPMNERTPFAGPGPEAPYECPDEEERVARGHEHGLQQRDLVTQRHDVVFGPDRAHAGTERIGAKAR